MPRRACRRSQRLPIAGYRSARRVRLRFAFMAAPPAETWTERGQKNRKAVGLGESVGVYGARNCFVLERETGIEPATNSLEGCDSTIELLPLVFVFSNFHCGLLRSFAANGAQWRQFAQSLHKAGAPLHKCTKSPPGPRYASCREPPS